MPRDDRQAYVEPWMEVPFVKMYSAIGLPARDGVDGLRSYLSANNAG